MKISKKDWQNYIARLRKTNETAAKKVAHFMETHNYSTPEGVKQLIDYAHAVATKYGEGASELSCQMLDAVAEASSKYVPAAEPAATATYGEIAKTIYGTLATTRDPDAVGAAVGRSVKLASVDTLQQNALRDRAEWAWIPSGDTCPFCLMLASRGWVRASKKAIKNGHADHIHNNCDCTYCVRFDHETTVEGYDPDALYEQYVNAGDTPRERLNALRRQHYAANKEHINAQKRVIWAEHKPEREMLKLARHGNNFTSKLDNLNKYAEKIEPIEGYTDIVGHGDPFSMVFRDADGNESNVSAKEFADILEKGGIYQGGKIRLIACQTGAGDGVVPTYLAKRFNTEVLAPTEIVNVDSEGKMILADVEENAKMGIETGEWVLFGPNGRIK